MSLQAPGHARYAKKALAIFRQQGDLVRQANVLNNLGIAAYYVGDWNAALDYYQRSREARERAGDVVGVATQENNIGEILSDQGCLDEADACFQDALLTWRGARYPVGIALATSNLGRLAARRGQVDSALGSLQAARDGFEAIRASAFVLETKLRMAEALVFAGRPHDALTAIAGVIDRLGPGTEVLQAAVHRVHGYALLQSGQREQALAELEDSLRTARAASAEYEAALTLEALAEAAADASAAAEARAILERLGVVATPRVTLSVAS
jgi:tetratricopeptide (TPR) repeat protein